MAKDILLNIRIIILGKLLVGYVILRKRRLHIVGNSHIKAYAALSADESEDHYILYE